MITCPWLLITIKKQFMWWSPLKHSNRISIPCYFCVMFVIHQCCCYFFLEIRILFSPQSKQLVVWWWSENPCLSRRLNKLYIYFRRLSISSSMKLELSIEIDSKTSYGLISITSSSSSFSLPFSYCSSLLYRFWIFWMISST